VVLCWPTRLSAHDHWGYQISCGSGVIPDYEQAAAADDATTPTEGRYPAETGYADRCQLTVRRHRLYAVGLALLGALLAALTALGGRSPRHGRREIPVAEAADGTRA
jgi:hypothetical protein